MSESEEQKKSSKGLGLAVIAATAAASYFLYGKNGSNNRQKVKGWMLKAKGEALEKIEKMRDIDEEKYYEVLSKVEQKYSNMKNIEPSDVQALVGDMRKHWKKIQKDIEPKKKKAKTKIKKAINTAAKKTARITEEKKPTKIKKVVKKKA